MYLRGLGGIVVRMPDGNQREFSAISTDLENALLAGGAPLRPNGSVYSVSRFMGGWLFDNCPLNVILGQGWIAGQQDALRSAGLVPTCPQVLPAAPVQPAAPAPVFTQVAAPGFQPQMVSASGAPILATGVATPTGPSVVFLPGGAAQVTPATPATDQGQPVEAGMGEGVLALGGLALLFLFGRRKRG